MAAPTVSEYYDEYCLRSSSKKNASKSNTVAEIQANETKQPVGGRQQEKLRNARLATANQSRQNDMLSSTATQRAHQRQPQRDLSWKFHDVSEPLRCDHVIMYEPIGRHLWNENNMYAFGAAYPIRREMKEAENMFANPLPVPDVHKLRYMSNNYMTLDDWYYTR